MKDAKILSEQEHQYALLSCAIIFFCSFLENDVVVEFANTLGGILSGYMLFALVRFCYRQEKLEQHRKKLSQTLNRVKEKEDE